MMFLDIRKMSVMGTEHCASVDIADDTDEDLKPVQRIEARVDGKVHRLVLPKTKHTTVYQTFSEVFSRLAAMEAAK